MSASRVAFKDDERSCEDRTLDSALGNINFFYLDPQTPRTQTIRDHTLARARNRTAEADPVPERIHVQLKAGTEFE